MEKMPIMTEIHFLPVYKEWNSDLYFELILEKKHCDISHTVYYLY